MKINLVYLLIGISLYSCNSKNENQVGDQKNKSMVIVEIANAESEKLALSIQGGDYENRKTQKIENGKAIFEVEFFDSDVVWIESVYNIENINGPRWFIPILLDNDTIVVKSKLIRDSVQISETEFEKYYAFREIEFKRSNLNINYKENSKKLFDLAIKEPIGYDQFDSLNKKVFPMQRIKMINLFENEFSNLNQRIQLELLDDMLNFSAFEPEYLNDENREEINLIYYNLSDLTKSANYRLKKVEFLLSNINNYGKENQLTFKNFNLIDIYENKVDLQNIVKQNELTVFYFWFSSCGPCRSFNENINNDIIKELNENDIEFVSINTDINKEYWKKASKQDNIFWQNLYGGNLRDDIEIEYGFKGYPFKVIFNRNLELIDFNISKPKDLLELIKLKKRNQIK